MAQTIKIKRSGSASATPSSLEHGELAINYADGKIYYKNSSNNIVEFTTSASGSFLPLSGGTLTGTLNSKTINLQNHQIYAVNNLRFNDPGVNEGIKWDGGNEWQIYESPDNQTNNSGNLQFTSGSGSGTRRLTLTTGGHLNLLTGGLQIGGTSVITSGKVLENVSGNISMFTNDSSYITNSTASLNANKITSGTISNSRLSTDMILSGAAPRYRLTETGVTNTPNWWMVADGGNYSIRLNNAGTYPLSIVTNSSNDAVSSISLGYNTHVVGNITLTGTVDSRDIASDGAKLDTIATNADVTPSWVPSSNPGYITSESDTLNTVTGRGSTTSNDVDFGKVLVGGVYSNNSYNSVSSTRLLFGGGNDPDNYHIGTNLENFGGNYSKLDLRWHTGIRMGAQPSYGGVRIFNNEDLSSVLFSVGKGDGHTRVESGNLYFSGGTSNIAWHAGNDGSGSGLDADTLDGFQSGYFATQGNLGNYLPLSGGTMTGTITSRDILLQSGRFLMRSNHQSGHLEGSYNNIGANDTKSNPIYTIGSNYNPDENTLSNMYGVGYSHYNASFISFTGNSGWGFYVAADGDARVFLNGSNGQISSTGQHYVGSNVVWNAGNDGSGSGLDADTLDGINSGSFLRSDTDDTFTGNSLGFPTLGLYITNNNSAPGSHYIRGNSTHIVHGTGNGNIFYLNYGNSSGSLRQYGAVYQDNTLVGNLWGSSNDGSGSGLDADLLDGQHGSHYLNYNNFTNTPSIPSVGNGTLSILPGNSLTGSGTFTANQSGNTTVTLAVDTPDDAGTGGWYDIVAWNNQLIKDGNVELHGAGYLRASYLNMTHSATNRNSDTVFYSSTDDYIRKNTKTSFRTSLDVYSKAETNALIPSVGNGTITITGAGSLSGSGSFTVNQSGNTSITLTGATIPTTLPANGGNADTVDNLHANNSSNTAADALVRTQANGYIFSSFLNTTSGDAGTTTPTRFYASYDNYIRYYDWISMKSFMNSPYSRNLWHGREQDGTSDTNYHTGSIGWGSTFLNDTTAWDVGSGALDNWNQTGANSVGSSGSHFVGLQAMHYSAGTSSSRYGFRIINQASSANVYAQTHWGAGKNTYKLWHDGNDGSGSGLDSDLLDGQHGSYYLNYNNFSNTPSIPSVGNGTINITTSGSASGGGSFTVNQSGGSTINISATDTNTTYSAGSGLDLSGTTFSHSDTSSVSNVNNSGNTFIQDITFDTYGHVTSVTSATATGSGGGGSFTGGQVPNNTFFHNQTGAPKVGIRTLSPQAALDVNGTIKAQSLNVNDKLWMVAQPVSGDQGYVQSDAYGHGGHFGHYIENGVTASDGNSYTIGDVNSVPEYTAAFGRFGKVVEDIRVATFRLTYPSYNWLFSFPKQLVEVPYFQTQIKPMLQILGASVFVDMLNGQSGGAGLTGNKVDIFQIGYWRKQHLFGSQSTDSDIAFKPVLRFPKSIYNANLKDNVQIGATGTAPNFYYCEMERDPVNGGVAYPDHHIFLSSNTHDWGNNSSNQNNLVFTIKLRYKLIHPSGDFSQSIATTFGGG